MKLADGKYYIVVSDRSGNSYTIIADVNVSALECDVKESENNYVKFGKWVEDTPIVYSAESIDAGWAHFNTLEECKNLSLYGECTKIERAGKDMPSAQGNREQGSGQPQGSGRKDHLQRSYRQVPDHR